LAHTKTNPQPAQPHAAHQDATDIQTKTLILITKSCVPDMYDLHISAAISQEPIFPYIYKFLYYIYDAKCGALPLVLRIG